MEVAASVIAVVSLALQSTQILYTTISGYKNASPTIQRMTTNLQDLAKVLQQLVEYGNQLDLATELPDLVSRCLEHLKSLEKKLGKLSSSTNNKAKNCCKNFLSSLEQSDLDRMSALLYQHVAVLSLQLNILEGRTISSQTASLKRAEVLSNKQLTLTTTNSVTLESTRADVNDLKTISLASSQSTFQALEGVSDKLRDLAGLSTEQTTTLNSTLNSILELLQRQPPVKSGQETAEAVSHEDIDDLGNVKMRGKPHETLEDDGLQDALDRLCQFAKEEEKTLYSADAESIIRDIEQMLAFLLKADDRGNPVHCKRKRQEGADESVSSEDRDLQYRYEVKRIKGLLDASYGVAINERVPQASTAVAAKSKIKNATHRRRARDGTFIFRTRRRVLDVAATQGNHEIHNENDELETLEASINFVPDASQTNQITVFFQQKLLHDGSLLKNPILSVSAFLPDNSEVFLLIEDGNLTELTKKLSLRQASLTDRDSEGRSLLNYALSFVQPEICKFLIDRGADVDFVENQLRSSRPAHSLNMLHDMKVDYDDYDPKFLTSINQCQLLLLEAGTDPTIVSAPGPFGSFMDGVLQYGTANEVYEDNLALLFKYGREFMEADDAVRPAKFLLEHLQGQYWTVRTIAFFLRMHKDLKWLSQDLDGCLHQVLCGSCREEREGLTNALILLIDAGADVYAKDVHGCSASERACTAGYYIYEDYYLQQRDIWVEALNACGYNAEEVISSSITIGELQEMLRYETSESTSLSGSNGATQLPEAGSGSSFDLSLLEGDEDVWRS
ncbi:MAG: hypothetical protein M1812_002010 [Candelaria pacifica]|nr:MAG: hypothetical protein M1812_002010 [Candelaria pacifica]